MGKKKKNKNKNKVREPDGTYLVVVDPWGTPSHPNFVNNVSAWFQVMLSDSFHRLRVDAVYTHKQHNNIIVEFSSTKFDPRPFTGTHYWSQFLSSPYRENPAITDSRSFLYEYNFSKYLEPGERGWKTNIPTYQSIPSNFPIKSPYPTPEPAPPPPTDVPYAIQPRAPAIPIEPMILDVTKEEEAEYTHIPNYTKVDDFLNGLDIDIKPSLQQPLPPKEEPHEPPAIKQEPGRTPPTTIKQEPHEPSPAFSKQEPGDSPVPPNVRIKSEEFTPALPPSPPSLPQDAYTDEYEPSAELLAAFAGLPQNYLAAFSAPSTTAPVHSSSSSSGGVRVKDEPVDDPSPFSALHRARSTTLATEHEYENGTRQHSPVARIKPEPSEPTLSSLFPRGADPPANPVHSRQSDTGSSSSANVKMRMRIKPEPREDTVAFPGSELAQSRPHIGRGNGYDRSRDPRLAKGGLNGRVDRGVKREVEEGEVEEGEREGVKRVKIKSDGVW